MSMTSIDTVRRAATSANKPWAAGSGNISQTLELSELRTYDAALETLGAYKLTGNFPTELEIVLKDLRVLDEVTFDIKPKSPLSDCRHVEFRPDRQGSSGPFPRDHADGQETDRRRFDATLVDAAISIAPL